MTLSEIQDGAACRDMDTEVFFPHDPTTAKAMVRLARKTCNGCSVKEQCLEWALKNERHGVWGGTTAEERVRMRKEKR